MEHGKDYLLVRHPNPRFENHNVIILRNEPYRGVVLEYSNIRIIPSEPENILEFDTTPVHVPEDTFDLESDEFEEYISSVMQDLVESHDKRDAMIYVSAETGEQLDV